MNAPTNSLRDNQLDLDPKDGNIPFILCTPTKNNVAPRTSSEDNTDIEDTVESSPEPFASFYLQPRRSCQCCDCHSEKDANAKPVAGKSIDFSLETPSPRGSPEPTTEFSDDIMVTPPRINLLKRRQTSSQELHHHDDAPEFPFLRRQNNDHRLQDHQQQQQQLRQATYIRFPIPRRIR